VPYQRSDASLACAVAVHNQRAAPPRDIEAASAEATLVLPSAFCTLVTSTTAPAGAPLTRQDSSQLQIRRDIEIS